MDRLIGTLIDAGFDPARISAVPPSEQADGATDATPAEPADRATTGNHGIGAWLVAHLRQRGPSHEHAQQYAEHVANGRRLVSVAVTTDVEDAEHVANGRRLVIDIGAEEISSAADGTMHVVHHALPSRAEPPSAWGRTMRSMAVLAD